MNGHHFNLNKINKQLLTQQYEKKISISTNFTILFLHTISYMCITIEGLSNLFEVKENTNQSIDNQYAFVTRDYKFDYNKINTLEEATFAAVGQIIGQTEYFNKKSSN